MNAPFAPVPKGRSQYGSEQEYQAAVEARRAYEAGLKESHERGILDVKRTIPMTGDASAGGRSEDPGYTYTARVLLKDGSEVTRKIRGVKARSKGAARREGRQQMLEQADVEDIARKDDGRRDDRANKPRGKPFKPGSDERRRNDEANGSGSPRQQSGGQSGGRSGDGQAEGSSASQGDSESSANQSQGSESGGKQDMGSQSSQSSGSAADSDSQSQDQNGGQQGDSGSQSQQQQQKEQDLLEQLRQKIKDALSESEQQAKDTGQQTGLTDLQILRLKNPALMGDEALQALGLISGAAVAPAFDAMASKMSEEIAAAASSGTVDAEQVKRIVNETIRQAQFDLKKTPTTEGKSLDEAIQAKIDEAVEQVKPAHTVVQVVENFSAKAEELSQQIIQGTAHKCLQQVVDLLQVGLPAYLVGPTGCGKTYLAHQVAEVMQRRFGSLSLTAGISESALIGRYLPKADGAWGYVGTEFQQIYEETGGVFLFDEVDAADPNVLLIVNQALANGRFPLPSRMDNPVAKRHPEFAAIAAANTWGTGANRQYVGRNQLDDATLDRFRIGTIEMDYDRDVEAAIIPNSKLLKTMWFIRDWLELNKVRRNLSTRFIANAHTMMEAYPQRFDISTVLRRLTGGWSENEIRQARIEEAKHSFEQGS